MTIKPVRLVLGPPIIDHDPGWAERARVVGYPDAEPFAEECGACSGRGGFPATGEVCSDCLGNGSIPKPSTSTGRP